MKDYPTCKTCKHFGLGKYGAPLILGVCEKEHVPLGSMRSESDENIYVGPYFGCIHHEQK